MVKLLTIGYGENMRPKSPINSAGGKQKQADFLIGLIPPHQTYVEVFGEGGSVLFSKQPSPVEVYNDINSDIVNFMRVLQDKDNTFQRFVELVTATPYSREEWEYCNKTMNDDPDPAQRARKFFVCNRYGFSAMNSFGHQVTNSSRGMCAKTSSYLNTIEYLPEFRDRIMRVLIEHQDFRKIIPLYDRKETLFYLDPPHTTQTRTPQLYNYKMNDHDHEDLIDLCRNIKGKAILSGYDNELYDELGWRKIEHEQLCHIALSRFDSAYSKQNTVNLNKRTECVWLNFSECDMMEQINYDISNISDNPKLF